MKKIVNLCDLNNIEMAKLKGGVVWDFTGCSCACAYEDSGGSTPYNNFSANKSGPDGPLQSKE